MNHLAINNSFAHRLALITDEQRAAYLQEAESRVESKPYQVINNKAIIPITGVISQDVFDIWFFGGTNPAEILSQIKQAEQDESVNEISFYIDSPGGAVSLIQEIAKVISNSKKKTSAYVVDIAASGSYWIASAAQAIWCAETAEVGSVGAVVMVIRHDDKNGVVEFISAQSPLKRVDPETNSGRSEYQRQADDIAEIFIKEVASNRNKNIEYVLENFGQGGMLIAHRARSAGMVDHISTFENFINSEEVSLMADDFKAALENMNNRIGTIEAAQTKAAEPDIKSPEEIRAEAIKATMASQQKLASDMRNVAILGGQPAETALNYFAEGKTLDEFQQFCLDEKAKMSQKTAVHSGVNPDVAGAGLDDFAKFDLDEEEVV